MRIEINKDIVADDEICHGKPVFKGTRVMVSIVLEMLEAGCSAKQIIKAYPYLTNRHVKSALEFAANLTGRRIGLIAA